MMFDGQAGVKGKEGKVMEGEGKGVQREKGVQNRTGEEKGRGGKGK